MAYPEFAFVERWHALGFSALFSWFQEPSGAVRFETARL